MTLTPRLIPWSSIVGSGIELCDETGAVVALLIITIPNPEFESKTTAELVGKLVVAALGKAPAGDQP